MNIRFWGVRGSIPSPLTPEQVQKKIADVVDRITLKDIETPEAKKEFLDSLPNWLKSSAGGNTPCIEITGSKGTKLILDAGSGLRVLGKNGTPPEDFHYNLFFSHFHWDHIQGLPFFDHAYNPKAVFDVYSPFEDMEKYLSEQMVPPYYPVKFDALTRNFNFHVIKTGESFKVGEFTINCVEMSHPGKSYSYLIEEDGKKFVYATDVELGAKDFILDSELSKVFKDADILILDSQYTVEEALKKVNWGHSAFCYAIDFALSWNAKKLYLFHHEPTYDDQKLNSILDSAKWYADYVGHDNMEVLIAVEGQEITL